MAKGKQSSRGRENPKRILAGWQKAVLWAAWLGVIALIIKNTDSDSLGGPEFLAIIVATAITVFTCKNPKGPANIVIRKSDEVRGVFESRTNWPMVLLAGALTLFGLAMTVKLSQDLSSGRATWKDVLDDIAHFFIEEIIQRISGGTSGDVTNTKLYIMAILLPIGLLMIWFTLSPFLHRGRRYRVEEDGGIKVQDGSGWNPLELIEYKSVEADGVDVSFFKDDQKSPTVTLPIGRVYSRDLGTRVETKVLVKFFRDQLEACGFAVEKLSADGMVETSLRATRGDAGAVQSPGP